jgi:tripartite-type tricarboxylate transporter receptor subunit TctC
MPQVKTGKVRVIATSAPKRLSYMPEVQTFGEAGIAGFEMGAWQGLLAPAGTPRAIIDRLHSEIVKMLAETETRQRLAALGSDPVGSSPEEFRAKIQRELQEFGKIIRILGLKV